MFFAIIDGKQIRLEGDIWSLRAQVSMHDIMGSSNSQVVMVKHLPTTPVELWLERGYAILRRNEGEPPNPDVEYPPRVPDVAPGVTLHKCQC